MGSLVISSAVVLAGAGDGLSLDHPVIGWRNVVTPSGLSASDTALASFPVSNLANPATHLEWRATNAIDQYIYVTTNEVDPIDYIAAARHNWGSAAISVTVQGLISGIWETIVDEVMLADDGPALFRFAPQSLSSVRFKLAAGNAPPRAAVVYCGKLLVIERKIYVGHTPLPHGRKRSVANGRSESGNFLGRIVLGESRESTVPLSLISPDWYRATMDPFVAAAGEDSFFFAWRSQSYPREVGYCWLMDDPMPVPTGPSNLIAFDMKLGGIA